MSILTQFSKSFTTLLFLTLLSTVHAADSITTIAGDGTSGYAGDGKDAAKDGRLNTPSDILIGPTGNVYIVDTNNHILRRVDNTGILTTLAGQPQTAGYSDTTQPATQAQFNHPNSIVTDGKGNFYIADTSNHAIRKMDTEDKVSTLAGKGDLLPGYAGDTQPAIEAQLNAPKGLALDGQGNLYVADTGNHVIRKIENVGNPDSKPIITTVVGGGTNESVNGTPATTVQLKAPSAIALDSTGNILYIVDSAANRILKVENINDADPTKHLASQIAGGGTTGLGDGGLAIAAQLQTPSDLALDSQGNLYIADTGNHRIRKVDVKNIITTLVGTGTAGSSGDGSLPTNAQLNGPLGITIDSQDTLYIADTNNHRIRKILHQEEPTQSVTLTIILAGTGTGVVTGPVGGSLIGINCGTQCTETYSINTPVALQATAGENATFVGWSGDCTDTQTAFTVTLNADKKCTATFDRVVEPSTLTFVEAQRDGISGVDGLAGATSVVVSADGQFVYATGYFDNGVAVFQRDANTGLLTFTQVIKEGINNVKDLQGANAIAVSPDNKNVYVTGSRSNAIVVLNRDLTLVQFQENGVGGVDGLGGVSAVALSADGQRVYATGTRDNALVVFSRNDNSGLLTFLEVRKKGVAGLEALAGATSVATTHSLTALTDIYVASSTDNAITHFRRDPAVGELTFVVAMTTYPTAEGKTVNFSGVYGILVSPDDNHVYVTQRGGIVVFSRDLTTGVLTFQTIYSSKVSGISGFTGSPLAIKPDGTELYVTSVDDNALTIFARDPKTGLLVMRNSILNNTGNVETLDGVMGVAISPDGRHLYTASLRSNAVSLFSAMAIDLEVTMTDNPDPVAINSPLTYTITVTNKGNDAAPDVVLTDTLPSTVTFVSATPSQGTCVLPTIEGQMTCQLGTLDTEKPVTIEVKVTTPATVSGKQDKLVHKATVTTSQKDSNEDNNIVQEETIIKETVPQADLAVSLTTTPASTTMPVNSTFTYTFTVINQGPDTATENVLTITLPTGVTFNAANSDPDCTPTTGDPLKLICTLGTGDPSAKGEMPIVVTLPATPANLTLTATFTGKEADPMPDNNTVTHSLNVIETVDVDLEVLDAFADPNTLAVASQKPIVYKIKVRNNANIPANEVTLTGGPWPTKQVGYVSDTAGCTFDANDNLVCKLGTLDGQATKEVNIQTMPLEPGLDIPIKFTVASSQSKDSNSVNDSKVAILNISGQVANLVVSVADSTAGKPAAINSPITYTITVNNNGPQATVASLKLELSLPKGDAVLEDVTGTGITCKAGSTSASSECTLPTLLPNDKSIITAKVTPKGTGTLSFTATATVTGDAFDPTKDNNKVTKDLAISDANADLAITLAASPLPVLKGEALTFETAVTNNGPDEATDVAVELTLPASFTFKSAESDNLGGDCVVTLGEAGNSLIKCPLNPLPESKSYLLRIVTTPTEGGRFDSSVTVTSNVFDPVLTDNTAILLKNDGVTPIQIEVTQFLADLGVTTTLTPDSPVVNNTLIYTLTVTNQGPNDATEVNLTNTLPPANQVRFDSAKVTPAVTGNQCYDPGPGLPGLEASAGAVPGLEASAGTRLLTCSIAKLPANGTATVTLTVTPLTVGDITHTVSVKSAEYDANANDNQVTTTTYVNNPDTLFFVEALKDGEKGVVGLQRVIAIALTPDGNHLYAVSFGSNALVVFSRNPSDGKLSYVQTLTDNQTGIDGLDAATDVAVSPDGSYIYATALNDSAVSVFKRDTVTGQLTFVEIQKDGTGDIDGLGGPFALHVIDKHVYVAGSGDDAVAVFARDSKTGKLTFVEAQKDPSLDGIDAITVSPDGLQVVTANANSDSLTVFNRDPTTGRLSLLQTLTNGMEGVQGLDAASDVLFSPDNKQLYATAGGTDNTLSVFRASPTDHQLSSIQLFRDGQAGLDGLNGAAGLTLSPDGNYLYVAGTNDNAITMFKRDPVDGKLTFLDMVRNTDKGLQGLGGARAIAVSPTGSHIYVAGFGDHAITLLRIASSDLQLTLSSDKTSVNIAEGFAYTVTVTNNGPNPATNLVLTANLPAHVRLLQPPLDTCNVEINTSSSAEESGSTLTCQVDYLEADHSLKLTLLLSANDTGEFTTTVTVTSDQFDPTSNTAQESIKVVSTADLELSMLATPTLLSIGTDITYHLTVTNKGPDVAKEVIVTDTLPENMQFVSATTDLAEGSCQLSHQLTEVLCTLPKLQTGSQSLLTLVLTATMEGKLTNRATVTSAAVDPQLPNNNTEQTVTVTLNIIDETYDNQTGEVRDYIISPTGAVIGGKLSGTITNQGLIKDAHILPNTLIKGECAENLHLRQALSLCGKLSGTITNEGTLENVQLLSDTTINGGLLRGDITGFPASPAILNSTIAAGTRLSYVHIAVGSVVDPKAILGDGARFLSNSNIPPEMDLMTALPFIIEPISNRKSVHLLNDILVGGDTLLTAINKLPDLANNNLVLTQDTFTGNVYLAMGNDLFVLSPALVRQAPKDAAVGITLNTDGSVVFITESRRWIEVQPSIQSPASFQDALTSFGLSHFTAHADGNLTIDASDLAYFTARPDWQTQAGSPFDTLGLEAQPSPFIKGAVIFLLRFVEKDGVTRRQQYFYPAAAHPLELRTVLAGIPGASAVKFYNNGTVSVTINDITYTAAFDYLVQKGPTSKVTQLLIVPDQNGDGSEDVRVVYANGDQQLLFLVPFPELVTQIQAIPEVQRRYTVTEDVNGNLVFMYLLKRQVMQVTNVTQVSADTPSSMVIYPDGSGLFVTDSGQQIRTQPLVQDLLSLQTAIRSMGLQGVLVEGNGNLTIAASATLSYSARPALESTLTWLTMPTGLQVVPTSLPGVINVILVFRDEMGNKRQQLIYPAALDPQNLYTFFANAPGVSAVTLNNDGTIAVLGTGPIQFRGMFDYAVQTGDLPTGGIQFTEVPDVNGDGITDYLVSDGNGRRQVIYRLP